MKANFVETEEEEVVAIYGEACGNTFGCELALLAHMIRRLLVGFIFMCWKFKRQDGIVTDLEAHGAERC